MTGPMLVCSNQALAELCQAMAASPAVALDTEFIRVGTFYPQPALIQLADLQQIALVDPLVIDDWQPLIDLLLDASRVKVLHACDEDIELLHHFLGIWPVNVFDTQAAAALCGHDYSMSYQRLVKALLDVDIDKGHSRSDWLQRPLSEAQLLYAADDVRYLLALYRMLHGELQGLGRLGWLDEEYRRLLANLQDDQFADAFLRFRDSWRLDAQQLARLKVLASWREQAMRDKNLPRKRIATDEALMTLAQRSGWTLHKLFHVDGLPPATVKKQGEMIVALLAEVDSRNDYQHTVSRLSASDTLVKAIRRQLAGLAGQAQLAEQMLARKPFSQALHEQLAQGGNSLPDCISGWRRPFYQQVLEQCRARQE